MTQATFRGSPLEHDASGTAPLITLYERDDAIAVPLLSQLRMAGYDVRASRTPVELFDILSKQLVALVLVDLGAATAGRREFWVALDAQRRGRAIQVMTFRFITPHGDLDLDSEPSARAIADVEAHGVHEFQRIIDGVRQRVPLHGAQGAAPLSGVSYTPNGGIQPLGAALGMTPTPFSAQNGHLFNAPGAPGVPNAAAPASWNGVTPMAPMAPIAPLGVSPLVAPLDPSAPGSYPQAQSLSHQTMGPAHIAGYGTYGPMNGINPAPPHISAQMETAPFDPANPQQGFPFGPSFTPPGASPFANPTPSNPFGPASSPFAQPYEANPFSGQISAPVSQPAFTPPAPISQPAFTPPAPPVSQPPFAPSNPAAGGPASQWPSWNSPAAGSGPSAPSAFPPGPPSSFPPGPPSSFPPGPPSSFPPGAPSSVPPWGSSGAFAIPGFGGFGGFGGRPDSSPAGFDSTPGFGPMSQPPFAQPSAPAFQDAWSPPDAESDTPTGVIPEIAFQRPTPSDSWETMRGPTPTPTPPAPSDAWETVRGPIAPPLEPDYIPPRSQLTLDPDGAPPASAAPTSTPTENALGSVLVDGALLTPGKLEALKGIQAMLANVNIHRKLGDLALMFKFLSSDQLLAAVLVSRGLVSPQQIASLGRVKQELAASGVDNDLETLLVSFRVLPAEQLHKIRAELAG